MKKAMVLALIGLIVGTGYAQAPQRPRLLNRGLNRPSASRPCGMSAGEYKFMQSNPTGTNEFGRTWKVQCEYEKFMKENPDGKNKFGKTFDEQRNYEAEFDIKSFLGFEFGEHCSKYMSTCKVGSEGDYCMSYPVRLDRQFRLFERVLLESTQKRRLAAISFAQDVNDVSYECLSNEVDKLVALFEKQYKVELKQCKDRLYSFQFKNEHVDIDICLYWIREKCSGGINLKIRKEHIFSSDKEQHIKDKEQRIKEKENASKSFDIPAEDGLDLMNATTPNIATNTTQNIRGGSLGARRRLRQAQAEVEKAQCEAEREEKRKKLEAIQEELKRYREAKAVEKASAEFD